MFLKNAYKCMLVDGLAPCDPSPPLHPSSISIQTLMTMLIALSTACYGAFQG